MGRYDGDYYEHTPRCPWGSHAWGMNGRCFTCRCSRDALVGEAKKILADPHGGGRYAG